MTPIVNTAALDWTPLEHAPGCARKTLSRAVCATDLAAALYRVAPGAAAFPHHAHLANHEALWILHGQGALRLDGRVVHVSAGDYVHLAPGVAHQLRNVGPGELRYLCTATQVEPDVVQYPDSDKIGVIHRSSGTLRFWRDGDHVPYLEGEE